MSDKQRSSLKSVPRENQFFSPSSVCRLCQILPGQMRTIVEDLGILPDYELDEVPFFNGDKVLDILHRARELRAEIENAAQKFSASANN